MAMHMIKARHLDAQCFQRYGTYANMIQPSGNAIGELPVTFYPDVLNVFMGASLIGFSTVITEKRDMIVTEAEQHASTLELLLPLDGDVVIFVAPPTVSTFNKETVEAFIVPKGTLIVLNAGVWHKAPFPISAQRVSTLVVLPERTYANDCTINSLNEEQQFKIILD